jgi:hypothetical protein
MIIIACDEMKQYEIGGVSSTYGYSENAHGVLVPKTRWEVPSETWDRGFKTDFWGGKLKVKVNVDTELKYKSLSFYGDWMSLVISRVSMEFQTSISETVSASFIRVDISLRNLEF